MMDKQWPLTIIAMQGYPYTGKTTLANALAKRLKFSILRFEDALDFISPGKPEKADTIKSRAFDLLTKAIKTQISVGISVVVDSPLSHRTHFDKLVALVTEPWNEDHEVVFDLNIRLIIIECNPKNRYTWQMRFKKRNSSYRSKWYKPKTRMDREFERDYTDEDIDSCLVSKLVVNTTNYVSYDDLVQAIRDLSKSSCRTVDLEKWRQQNFFLRLQVTGQVKDGKINKEFCRDGHCVNEYTKEGTIDYYAICEVCESVVAKSDAAYTCSICPLVIHKSCAELDNCNKFFTPENFPKFLDTEPKPSYCFPEEHLCLRCIVEGKNFSYECDGCVYQCHLKCKLIPTILHHQGHQGRLFFSIKSILTEHKYMCAACKQLGNHAAYGCVQDCNIYYHPECASLPSSIEHEHCGYTHDLDLIYQREKELEDYICHLCFEELDPEAWYYNCKTCYLELHLDCTFKEFI